MSFYYSKFSDIDKSSSGYPISDSSLLNYRKFTLDTPRIKWTNRNFLNRINEELSPSKNKFTKLKFPNKPSYGVYIAIYLHWGKF